jgi:hypothetical protein
MNNRRKQVAALYLNKVEQIDIAAKLKVSQGTVSLDLKALNKQWEEKAQADVSAIKARELAELDLMELEAAAQYQVAKKEKKELSALKYAAHRLDIKDRRARMLGLDKPAKVELDANLKHSKQKDPSEMSDEELEQAIEDDRKKLIEAGILPDFKTV